MPDPENPGKIITFYSYKGGTGRSMAVANIGSLLSREPKSKILLIDWDLEAPGLHRFFQRKDPKPGVIDYFTALDGLLNSSQQLREMINQATGDRALAKYLPLRSYTIPINPNMDIMPAGALDSDYPKRIGSFDWQKFHRDSPEALNAFRNMIAAEYSYCLIDSRTGLNEKSGICTALLPEKIVAVFTPNSQNLDGVIDVLRRSTAYRRYSPDFRPLSIFPLPSRVENAETQLRQSWRKQYQEAFEELFREAYELESCNLHQYFNKIQLPHASYYAYGESVAVEREEKEDSFTLSQVYSSFLRILTSQEFPWAEPEWEDADARDPLISADAIADPGIQVVGGSSIPSVMVSSTFTDLQPHRAALVSALQTQKLFPMAIENRAFANPAEVLESSLQMVRDSVAYIGILAHKYGHVPDDSTRNPNQLSITELEFNEAERLNLPILLFVMSDEHLVPIKDIELDPARRSQLSAFKDRARSISPSSKVHRVYATFNSLEDFRAKATQSVAELRRQLDQTRVLTDRELLEYRQSLAADLPAFMLPRRFTTEDSWTRTVGAGGTRYLGVLRDYEPNLQAILEHKHLIILGEPGAGKSTAAKAIVQHLLSNETVIPIFASLKGYDGNLRTLLLRTTTDAVLSATTPGKVFVLDGIDEVPGTRRTDLRQELDAVIAADNRARIVLTSRQAFQANHPDVFPSGFNIFHLLDFDDHDIRAFAQHHGLNADTFIAAARGAECLEEMRNPFVLIVMIEVYKQNGRFSPLRYVNVEHVVDKLIRSRPLVNAVRQRRALRMLATACETAARNELTEEEALRVIHEAMDIPALDAQQLLDELSQSILIRTPDHISFQMRSYGEYLAAEELQDEPIERIKELAFHNNVPVDSWLNAMAYLAEMKETLRNYLAVHHPLWLLSVSPAALPEAMRTKLARDILQEVNERGAYIIEEKVLRLHRLAQIITPQNIAELEAQLGSIVPHEQANALVLLGALRRVDIAPQALQRAIENRERSLLRYSAIVALINTGADNVVNDLIIFAQASDPYYIQIVDAIGSLCTPEDFPRVLPILEQSDAGLSSAWYHFRELTSKDALTATIDYLTANPEAIASSKLDSFLRPIIDLIPYHWGNDIGVALGHLLVSLERARTHIYRSKILNSIINHLLAKDKDELAIKTMIGSLQVHGTPIYFLSQEISGLITPKAAEWIASSAPSYSTELAKWLPVGPVRDILDPLCREDAVTQKQARDQYVADEVKRAQESASTRQRHQNTIRTARNIGSVVVASARLETEHWPEISQEQRDWLATNINQTLEQLDLKKSIKWTANNQWTHPDWLNPLLQLTDFYDLKLANDVPIVLALRSWPEKAITEYYRRHGLTQAAQDNLVDLLQSAEHESITRNVLAFLRESGYADPAIRELLQQIALDNARSPEFRCDAIDLISSSESTVTLITLSGDQTPRVSERALRALIRLEHRPTISRQLGTLTDGDLKAAEVPFPNTSSLDWISTITIPEVIPELKALRKRTLDLNLLRVATVIAGAIANIDKEQAAAIIREQLQFTPEEWRTYARQQAEDLARAARTEAAQGAPFDQIIKRLKGATSMIRVKVWCEGSTDRPIFRALFEQLGENEIAEKLDFVGGWANFVSEQEPERWLDGCRQAVIIMDGDAGRNMSTARREYTDLAKRMKRLIAGHAIKMHILWCYGIENYFPQHACEKALKRDLADYFPIPDTKKIEEHFKDQAGSFYSKKKSNVEVAKYITLSDVQGTDLGEIIAEVHDDAQAARQY